MIWSVRTVRKQVMKRDGCGCRYCGKRLTLDTSTLDHIVPRALGGTDRKYNLCLACRDCNLAKANKSPHVFIAERMQGLVA